MQTPAQSGHLPMGKDLMEPGCGMQDAAVGLESPGRSTPFVGDRIRLGGTGPGLRGTTKRLANQTEEPP